MLTLTNFWVWNFQEAIYDKRIANEIFLLKLSSLNNDLLFLFHLFIVTVQLSYLPADELTLDLADVEHAGLQDKGNYPLISAEHWTLKEDYHWFTSGYVQCEFKECLIHIRSIQFIPPLNKRELRQDSFSFLQLNHGRWFSLES